MRRIPMNHITCTLVFAVVLFPTLARAQEAPPAPGTQPATQRARHVAQVPPGFKRVEVEGRTFFVMPEDEAWLTTLVQETPPATMPSTMPTDLLANLTARRDKLRARMVADLGVAPADVDEYLNQRLMMFLSRMEELR